MIKPITSTRILSILGNEKSLITLGVKDLGAIAGMTAGAYIAGKGVEGKDRFMDEVGTSIIWLCGVPAFKWIIDKTIYKFAKLNPKIDVRLLENKEIFKKAKEYAPQALKESFEKAVKNQKGFKGLFFAKLAASTALTLGAYGGLTVFRQKHTKKCVMQEIKAEEEQKKLNEKKSQNPNFGFNMKPVYQFLSNPVQNTQIIDGGITTQRLLESRNIQDFIGYTIREGGFLVAIYVVSKKIQSYLTKKAAEDKHRPIDLDIRVLTDDKLKKAFVDGSIKTHLDKLPTNGTDAQIYESLFEKGENLVVQMAKKAEIIPTENKADFITKILQKIGLKENNNEKAAIDTQRFVDIDAIKGYKKINKYINKKKEWIPGIKERIQTLYNEFKNSGKNADEFFNEVIKLKKASIAKGFGASVGILGIVIPGIILVSRLMKEENKEFRVKKEIKEKMQREKL